VPLLGLLVLVMVAAVVVAVLRLTLYVWPEVQELRRGAEGAVSWEYDAAGGRQRDGDL